MTDSPIPVLDISAFRADETSQAAGAFVAGLRDAFHRAGAAYLTGHGVDEPLNTRAHEVARAFFDLPEGDRLAIENINSPQFRGYMRLGGELTNGRQDLREQVDIGRDDAALELGPDDPPYLRLRGPNLWPAALPEFREVLTAWNAALERLGHEVTHAVARALGQPADRFDAALAPPELITKVIRYAPPSAAFATDQGVGAHRDGGFLTFVHQDAVGGLQALVGESWVDVPARPGAFVVNIGELLQLVSNGYFRATVHRVVSPPPGRDRISIAHFFNPRYEATIEPVELPAELARDAAGGESADPSNPILTSYGANSLKVRLRAHPDVAALHHPDLLAAERGAAPDSGTMS